MKAPLPIGQEWIVDASGCDPATLKDPHALGGLFEEIIGALRLSVVGAAQWHVFPAPGGVTGLVLLSESHLAIHTFPEHAYAALSVYSCRPREPLDFAALLTRHLKASSVCLRELPREAVR